jgi:hypothetical protein
VPHSDLSIVANNSDNWYGADKKVDRGRGRSVSFHSAAMP